MTQEEIGYDLRQLHLMLEMIELFEKDKITLDKLIANLEALVNVLQSVESAWKEEFIKEWAVLEITYACAIADNKTSLNEEEVEDIETAIESLKIIIEDKIKTFQQNDQEI
jgi:hypothetical protein